MNNLNKFIGVLAITLSAQMAFAHNIKCNFAEPFINFDIDETAFTVAVQGVDLVDANYPLQSIDKTIDTVKYVFGDEQADEFSVLELIDDGNGGNGMSELVTTYSATYRVGDSYPIHGGCYSDQLKAPVAPLCPTSGSNIEKTFCLNLEDYTKANTCEDAAKYAAETFNWHTIGGSLFGPIEVTEVKEIYEDGLYQVTYLDPTLTLEIYMPITMDVYVSNSPQDCWAVSVELK